MVFDGVVSFSFLTEVFRNKSICLYNLFFLFLFLFAGEFLII